MVDQQNAEKVKDITSEFLGKMTIEPTRVDIGSHPSEKEGEDLSEVIEVKIFLDDPKILIGQGGQTLIELQRLLRIILNKKLGKSFYIDLDINDYKLKKVEYLKDLAKEVANEVSLTKIEKNLSPMSSYERRVIHNELSKITDIISESEGDGPSRHIIVKPK